MDSEKGEYASMYVTYTKEQQEKALAEFERLGSVTAVIRELGYPSRATLYQWYEGKKAGVLNKHGSMEYAYPNNNHCRNTPEHPQIPSAELKLDTLHRCFELGEDVEYVARDIGYSRTTIYKWRKNYLEKGAVSLMSSKKKIPRGKLIEVKNDEIAAATAAEMQKKIDDLQLDVDILKETINILKKDPGVNLRTMKNREKAVIVDAMKSKYPLPLLFHKLCLAKSSYYYQESILRVPDKYVDYRDKITEIFHKNKECYGYRRVHKALIKAGDRISEKVVRRLMNEEKLSVIFVKKKKYSSYIGEISPAVKNVIARDFHSDKPNIKWLTDITEFAIPAGKVYLSPIIDCFDGKAVTWTISIRPNADLVNLMLDKAIEGLRKGDHPIIHTDRGCHYRWSGWISRMGAADLTRSMSKKGCSPDNSACEGFFGRLKNEMFYKRSWMGVSIEEFIKILNEYMIWYNEDRIKMSLGGMSPVNYRRSLGIAA